MSSDQPETNENENEHEVGFGKPPKDHQFKKGQSGNPRGRPKNAKGRRATVKKVLMEEHTVDPDGTGEPKTYSAFELVILLLKKMAAAGDQRAYRAFMDLEKRFGEVDLGETPAGYLVVPEVLTPEEWVARYSPKDPPEGG